MFKKTFIRALAVGLALASVVSSVVFSFRFFDDSVSGNSDDDLSVDTYPETEYVPNYDSRGVDLNLWEPINPSDFSALYDIFNEEDTYRLIFFTEDNSEYSYCIEYEGEIVVDIYRGTPEESCYQDVTVTFDSLPEGTSIYSFVMDLGGISIPTEFVYVLKKDSSGSADSSVIVPGTEYSPLLDENGVDLNYWTRISPTTPNDSTDLLNGRIYRFIFDTSVDAEYVNYGICNNGDNLVNVHFGPTKDEKDIDVMVLMDLYTIDSSVDLSVELTADDDDWVNLPYERAYILKEGVTLKDIGCTYTDLKQADPDLEMDW